MIFTDVTCLFTGDVLRLTGVIQVLFTGVRFIFTDVTCLFTGDVLRELRLTDVSKLP